MNRLTPRQTEVAALVAKGLSAPAIARQIGCALDTVRVHINQAAARLPGTGQPREKLMWFYNMSEGDSTKVA